MKVCDLLNRPLSPDGDSRVAATLSRIASIESELDEARQTTTTRSEALGDITLGLSDGIATKEDLAIVREAYRSAASRVEELESALAAARRIHAKAIAAAEEKSTAERWVAAVGLQNRGIQLAAKVEKSTAELAENLGTLKRVLLDLYQATPMKVSPRLHDTFADSTAVDTALKIYLAKVGFKWAHRSYISLHEAPTFSERTGSGIADLMKFRPVDLVTDSPKDPAPRGRTPKKRVDLN